jgi:hypothetical protein
MQQTATIQVEGMFQINLLDGGVGRAPNTDNVETVTVQMEWMTQIGLLDFINHNDFDDGIEWNVDFVCAHAVSAAISRTIVAVAELFGIYVVVL